jgi:hypothetical protein
MESEEWENMRIGRRKPKMSNIDVEEFRVRSQPSKKTQERGIVSTQMKLTSHGVTCKTANRRMASRGSYARSHRPRSTLHFGLVAERPRNKSSECRLLFQLQLLIYFSARIGGVAQPVICGRSLRYLQVTRSEYAKFSSSGSWDLVHLTVCCA